MGLARNCRRILACIVLLIVMSDLAPSAHASGQIDASTLVSVSHGTFHGISYVRYEAMFQGKTSNNRPYRVPCQIVTPANPTEGSGLLLFDWLVPSTIPTAVGQEQADARYTMTDEFLFGTGLSYATVRCQPESIGQESPVIDSTRPWSDDLLDTSSEFITSAGDEFDIVVDYVKALRSDPVALNVLGTVTRRAAFGYSATGSRLRGLLRLKMGIGLFDFSLVGGAGLGYSHPSGNKIGYSKSETAPLPGAGLEIDFNSEADVVLDGYKSRHEEPNYRLYEFAGTAHLRDIDVVEFGLPDPETANSAEWTPFIRALFVAGNNWCNGSQPPPTLWLGAPNDPTIVRETNGNALVTIVGGLTVNSTAYRLPEVAVGENQYIPLAPAYNDGTFFPGVLRFLAGGRIDLTGTFTDHDAYVAQVTSHAMVLMAQGYLLPADAHAIICEAEDSDIGNP